MVINYQRGLAASAARDMEVACRIAREITAHLPDQNYENPVPWIEKAASEILRTVRNERNDPTEKVEAHCLVIVQRPVHRMFRFQFASVDGEWGPFCQEMTRIAIAGDNVNGAIFWPESYYATFPHATKRLPVKNLIPLAAHAIVVAHRLNPVVISGLEVVFCDETGLHRLSEESLGALQEAATNWDKQFGKTIMEHSQDFTFDSIEPSTQN